MDGATEPYRDVFTCVFLGVPFAHPLTPNRKAKSRLHRGLNNPNHRITAALRNWELAVEVSRVVDGNGGKAASTEVLSRLLVVQEMEADITAGNGA